MDIFIAAPRQIHQHGLIFAQRRRELGRVGQRVTRLQRRDDAFQARELMKSGQRFGISDRYILRPARVFEPRVFGADAWIIKPC